MADFVTGMVRRRSGGTRKVLLRRGSSDSHTFKMIFNRHDYDIRRLGRGRELRDLYRDMVKDGVAPLIIDCGANIGLASLYFESHFPKSRIVAIEPAADNVELLHRNCQGLKNLHVETAAIASAPGFARIIDDTADKDAYRTELTGEDQGGLPTVTIGQLLERFCADGSVAPFIVKIDIEGAEEELFSKNTAWVARFPLIIIELHDWLFTRQATSRNFLKCMAEQERDFVYIGENIFSIRNSSTGN